MSVPSAVEVTVGENGGKLLQLGPDARDLNDFIKDFEGFIIYPHLVIPKDLSSLGDSGARLNSVLREISSFSSAFDIKRDQKDERGLLERILAFAIVVLTPSSVLEGIFGNSSSAAGKNLFSLESLGLLYLPKEARKYDIVGPLLAVWKSLVISVTSIPVPASISGFKTSAMTRGLLIAKQRIAQIEKQDSPVSSVAWHPYKQTFSISHRNNVAFVYDLYQTDFVSLPLYHTQQDYIYSMQWRPFSGSTLAIASKAGICLWNVHMSRAEDNTAGGVRSESSWMSLLSFPSLTHIHHMCWSPCGRFLAAASLKSSILVIWEVANMKPLPFQFHGMEGVISCLSWSPENNFIFVGTTRPSIFLVSVEDWSMNRYESPYDGIPQNPQWINNGQQLVFSLFNDSRIFVFSVFQHALIESIYCAFQFSENVINDSEGKAVRVGGVINRLCMDPSSSRLLVSFHSSSSNNNSLGGHDAGEEECRNGQDLVLAFDCQHHEMKVKLLPIGFISGPAAADARKSVVVDMTFAQTFDLGALALLAYSNGKISFLPFLWNNNKN